MQAPDNPSLDVKPLAYNHVRATLLLPFLLTNEWETAFASFRSGDACACVCVKARADFAAFEMLGLILMNSNTGVVLLFSPISRQLDSSSAL